MQLSLKASGKDVSPANTMNGYPGSELSGRTLAMDNESIMTVSKTSTFLESKCWSVGRSLNCPPTPKNARTREGKIIAEDGRWSPWWLWAVLFGMHSNIVVIFCLLSHFFASLEPGEWIFSYVSPCSFYCRPVQPVCHYGHNFARIKFRIFRCLLVLLQKKKGDRGGGRNIPLPLLHPITCGSCVYQMNSQMHSKEKSRHCK